MQRLAVALSATALVVALLGATPLGNAAEKTVKHVVRAAKPAHQARGPRGPRGYRGPRGFQGPPGIQGPKGDTGGLPDAYEARRTTPVEITGTTADTATTILATATLPTGNYAFDAQVFLQAALDSTVLCQAHGPGSAGARLGVPATMRLGSGAGEVAQGTIPLAFAASLAAPGSVYVSCWTDSSNSPHPTAESADLVALSAGSVSGP